MVKSPEETNSRLTPDEQKIANRSAEHAQVLCGATDVPPIVAALKHSIQDVRTLLPALTVARTQLANATEWRPMSTAPQDTILAKLDDGSVAVAEWLKMFGGWHEGDLRVVPVGWLPVPK